MSPMRVIEVKNVDLSSPNGVIDAIRRDPEANAVFTEFEKACADHMKAVHDECAKGLNEEELKFFEKWWKGGSLFGPGDPKVPEKAYGAIMAAVSAGCG